MIYKQKRSQTGHIHRKYKKINKFMRDPADNKRKVTNMSLSYSQRFPNENLEKIQVPAKVLPRL